MDLQLNEPAAPELGVAVDFDPAVWLPGPTDRTTDDWVERAFLACATDFEVREGTAEATYLRELLTGFADRDLASDFRFLRLRTLTDAPLVAMLSVYVDSPDDLSGALEAFDGSATYYDHHPQVVDLDPGRGLRRSMAFAVEGSIRPLVRYHRRIDAWNVDVLLSSAGAGLRATADGLADLDALAEAIWVVDADGNRR
jgi:hypothetical protein